MAFPAPPVGQTLGRYRLERLLGQGGFSWVYAASGEGDKLFALKVLKPRYSNDAAFEARFRQESELAVQLQHPNIVRLEEFGQSEGYIYFAMQFHPDTLAALLAREGRLDEPRTLGLAIGVTRALAFAHSRGVIHRDIKPDNVLLTEQGEPVLTDFGIARAISGYVAVTGSALTIGTPHFISPEQAQGRPVDGRADLYSLGITLYRTATGDLPFKSRDWYELARMHVEARPEPPRARQPDLSRRMERIILRLLAKHPDDRYPSAEALLADLEDVGKRTRPTAAIPVPGQYLRESGAAELASRWWKFWERGS